MKPANHRTWIENKHCADVQTSQDIRKMQIEQLGNYQISKNFKSDKTKFQQYYKPHRMLKEAYYISTWKKFGNI